MLRSVISAGLIAAIQVAALVAPFVHEHDDDHPTAHHTARAIHGHLSGHVTLHHRDDRPEIEAPDHDRAVYLPIFVAMGASTIAVGVATVEQTAELTIPVATYAHRSTESLPGHDPPLAGSLSPRAPPVSPAL